MTKLLELTEKFQVSRPIFQLTITFKGDMIKTDTYCPQDKYVPQPKEGDVLDELVCSTYSEAFNISDGKFNLNKNEIAKNAMDKIRSEIGIFVKNNLGMKNPRQSKLYRWVKYELPNNTEFNDVLVMVYKYLASFTNEDMRSHIGSSLHKENALALLTAMQGKYEQ